MYALAANGTLPVALVQIVDQALGVENMRLVAGELAYAFTILTESTETYGARLSLVNIALFDGPLGHLDHFEGDLFAPLSSEPGFFADLFWPKQLK